MGWRWADFWGFLVLDEEEVREKRPPARRLPSFRWGTPAGRVVAAVLIVAFFAGLAAWAIVHVVRFFGRFWGMADQPGE